MPDGFLLKLGIYAVLATVIVLFVMKVVRGVNEALEEHYVAPQRVIWEKEKAALEANEKAAVDANVAVRAGFENLRGQVQACNASIAALQQMGKSASEEANAALANRAATAAAKAVAQKVEEERAKAAGPPTTGDARADTKRTLSDLARDARGMRDDGATEAAH